MKLDEVYRKISNNFAEETLFPNRAKGIGASIECSGRIETSIQNAIKDRLSVRPGIEGDETIAFADAWVVGAARGIYNVTPEQVTAGLDSSVAKVMQEVASEYTKGGKGIQDAKGR